MPSHTSMKAFALLFAGLTAAKPLRHHLYPRQEVTAEATPAPTASPTSLESPIVQKGAVTLTVSGEALTCSVDSVTGMTTTMATTIGSTTFTKGVLTITPTLGCLCNDATVVGLGTSTGTDGLNTITVRKILSLQSRQTRMTIADVPLVRNGWQSRSSHRRLGYDPTYVAEWCQPLQDSDPEKLVALWEDKNVGHVLDLWTREKSENGGDNWLQNIIEHVAPTIGSTNLGGCGQIGGNCVNTLKCEDMVAQGFAAHYWILQAVVGFHSKLQASHEALQDGTIDNMLSIAQITEDFSAPSSDGMNSLVLIASLLSASIFLAGSVTGVVGALAGEAAIAANAVKASAQAAQRVTTDEAKLATLAGQIASSDKIVSIVGGTTRITNAGGAGLWTTASTFTMINAFADPKGQVDSTLLNDQLHNMFNQSLSQMETLGNLAMGRGGDYSALPTAPGSGTAEPLPDDSYIAGFFSDGKFLLAESSPLFTNTVQATYGTFKAKIVDQALQSGGLQVFAQSFDEEDYCKDENVGGPGAIWMDPLGDGTFYCMQLYRDNNGGGCPNGDGTCEYVQAGSDVLDKLTNDYGFNLENYYSAAAQCNKAGLENSLPDYTTMQYDGVTPACYYNIPAFKAKNAGSCTGNNNAICKYTFDLSDF
ncbi:uncharacterized protein LTR77_000317 [Saxophila tyrrhenica]|uniref:Uncharacterized protein n=1 Tax=Saxophila tyrrhenica TaxID=1690608 RepID=A0AAV9PQY0_9PEZI|nr:hypothetical protein LTR77_000317 [Saxophila tyrrhenica]